LQGSSPDGWIGANASRLRSLPLVAGASGIVGVLLNRLLSGVRAFALVYLAARFIMRKHANHLPRSSLPCHVMMLCMHNLSWVCLYTSRYAWHDVTVLKKHVQTSTLLCTQSQMCHDVPSQTCLQVAPVVDASSSQSRADVLVILLSAVLLLTGLQWLALRPKVKPSVCTSSWQLLSQRICLCSRWHIADIAFVAGAIRR